MTVSPLSFWNLMGWPTWLDEAMAMRVALDAMMHGGEYRIACEDSARAQLFCVLVRQTIRQAEQRLAELLSEIEKK